MAAIYRAIQTAFWTDAWVSELTSEQKYFYIYLLTNQRVSQCGIYEITIKQMVYETDLSKEAIEKLLIYFEKMKKIKFNRETSEICIANYSKYNYNLSPKVRKHVIKELNKVKDISLIQYLYGMDTLYKEYICPIDTLSQEKEKEKESQKEKQPNKSLSLSLGEGEIEKEKLLEVFLIEKNYPPNEFDTFWNHYSKTGWKDKNGNQIKDPYAAARNWTQLTSPHKNFISPEYHQHWKKVWLDYKEVVGFENAKYLLNIKPVVNGGVITFICKKSDGDTCEENIEHLAPLLRNAFGEKVQVHYKLPLRVG